MHGWKQMGWMGFDCLICDGWGCPSGGTVGMCLWDCGFLEPSLISLLPGRQTRCHICDFLPTISWVSLSPWPPEVSGEDATVPVCGLMNTRTFNIAVLYIIAHTSDQSAASPHPGSVNSSSLICFCRKLSFRSCTVLKIMPITQPGSSSSPSLRRSLSSWSSSSSSPSSSWLELTRSLRRSLIAFNISSDAVWDILVVNPTYSAFLVSFGSFIIAVSVYSTRSLATAELLSTASSMDFSFASLLN